MQEIWKDIKGYDGLYKVSNLGRVYSYPRYRTKGGYSVGTCCNGYLSFTLCKTKDVHIRQYIHILVWEAFKGSIPEHYVVHHKDHNKHNNNIDNLELLSDTEHKRMHSTEDYESKREKIAKGITEKKSIPVVQYTLDGQFVAEYKSATEAEKIVGLKQSYICRVCKGQRNQTGGYVWKYKDNNNELDAA